MTLLAWGARAPWRLIAALSLASIVVVVGLLPSFTHLCLRLLPDYPFSHELSS